MRNQRSDNNSRSQIGTIWLKAEVVAAFVAVFCYANTPFNDFCDDGIPIVEQNRKVNYPGQWGEIWTSDYWSDTRDATPNRDLLYRPLALSSYRLVAAVAGMQALPHLLISMLLHAVISVQVVRMCRHMGGSDAAALVAGTVFAALPIHSEVIDNVVGQADLLATFGLLLALLTHRRSMMATMRWNVAKWRIVAGLAAFAAMSAKESGISVVPVVVLLDGYWYRPWRAASRDRPWWSLRALFRLTYLLIPVAVYLALRYNALEGHLFQKPALTKTVNVLVDAPLWQHALGVVQLWGMYWTKTVWPQILCVNYSINTIRLATSVVDWQVIAGIGVTIGLVITSILAWRSGQRSVAYLVVALVIVYAPTSNSWVLIQVFFAERIWYLPSVWVAVLAGLAVLKVRWNPSWSLVAAVAVFAMVGRCWVRNAEWLNNRTLYAATYAVHHKAIGALRLQGQSLVEQAQLNGGIDHRKLEEGIELLRRAIEIDLGFTDAHRSLGYAYLLAEDFESALRHLQIANMQVPGHQPTMRALEIASQRLTERHEVELDYLLEGARERPDDVAAEAAVIAKLRELARMDDALARLTASEERFAADASWQAQYAVTLVYLNERDEAIERYRKCIELAPDDEQVLVELAMLLLERRENDDLDQAGQLAQRAAQLAPEAPNVLVCRAELVALRGNLRAAVELYQRAMSKLPADSSLRRIYHERATALGQ
ncbi:MAG: DUF1736 domain-containing protein [Planctomycetes bacterium]|nr:DUF1736 domain-containing protein [Planctomycetota bacterium]